MKLMNSIKGLLIAKPWLFFCAIQLLATSSIYLVNVRYFYIDKWDNSKDLAKTCFNGVELFANLIKDDELLKLALKNYLTAFLRTEITITKYDKENNPVWNEPIMIKVSGIYDRRKTHVESYRFSAADALSKYQILYKKEITPNYMLALLRGATFTFWEAATDWDDYCNKRLYRRSVPFYIFFGVILSFWIPLFKRLKRSWQIQHRLEQYEKKILHSNKVIDEKNVRISQLSAELDIEKEKKGKSDNRIKELTQELEKEREAKRAEELIRESTIQESQSISSPQYRILVIGSLATKKLHYQKTMENEYNLLRENVDFVDDYDKINKYNFKAVQYSRRYDGVIAGPIPHSCTGRGNYSSPIDLLTCEEGFPPTEVARTQSGELKITKESFSEALRRLIVKLSKR